MVVGWLTSLQYQTDKDFAPVKVFLEELAAPSEMGINPQR